MTECVFSPFHNMHLLLLYELASYGAFVVILLPGVEYWQVIGSCIHGLLVLLILTVVSVLPLVLIYSLAICESLRWVFPFEQVRLTMKLVPFVVENRVQNKSNVVRVKPDVIQDENLNEEKAETLSNAKENFPNIRTTT